MRNKANIDWLQVDKMLEAGCTGEEVAARLGCHADTLYRRVESENKIGFAAYRQQKIAKGNQTLRETLFKKALKGDTTALIFLAKTRLGMNEKMEVEHSGQMPLNQQIIQIQFRPPSDRQPEMTTDKGVQISDSLPANIVVPTAQMQAQN